MGQKRLATICTQPQAVTAFLWKQPQAVGHAAAYAQPLVAAIPFVAAVALMEAMALTKTMFGGQATKPDHENVPTAVFSHPQIATVGMSEEQVGRMPSFCAIWGVLLESMCMQFSATPRSRLWA